ncbi:hypothetical protein [Streptomyces sp. RerS4]|uniref:hypothetical protein n=1 Tax=Streptomyces sp. RerS4 TaxID=2942449 RepID=UPI00201C8FF1|nr:hypothetical protein [Streptomyces sp. RerS4]UQX00097.1 hypothetical protein M4D82_05735 [Streptomyces sp. RerS4]
MTTAEHLDLIDRLRAQVFPDRPVRLGRHASGPGHHLALLGGTADFWEDDGSRRAEAADQIGAEYAALVLALTGRWGPPQIFTLSSPARGGPDEEEIPEPWQEIGNSTDHVHLWWVEDRWLVVCVVRGAEEDPYLLMAGVTVTDPP